MFAALSIYYDEEVTSKTAAGRSGGGQHINSAILAILHLKQGQLFDKLIDQLAKNVSEYVNLPSIVPGLCKQSIRGGVRPHQILTQPLFCIPCVYVDYLIIKFLWFYENHRFFSLPKYNNQRFSP